MKIILNKEFLEMTQATKGMQDENYAKLLKEIQEGSRKEMELMPR